MTRRATATAASNGAGAGSGRVPATVACDRKVAAPLPRTANPSQDTLRSQFFTQFVDRIKTGAKDTHAESSQHFSTPCADECKRLLTAASIAPNTMQNGLSPNLR